MSSLLKKLPGPKKGESYILRRPISGRPSVAQIMSDPEHDYLIKMEGKHDKTGNVIQFMEHESLFHKRWAKQMQLFEGSTSKLARKYLKK